MAIHLCLIVDSNLKHVRLGRGCPKIKPYIRCDGRLYCPYVISEPGKRGMPTVDTLREQGFTDIVIARGMNHSRQGGVHQDKAIIDLLNPF